MVCSLVIVRSDGGGVVPHRRVLSALREERSPSAGVVNISGAGILGPYLSFILFFLCFFSFFLEGVGVFSVFDLYPLVEYFFC